MQELSLFCDGSIHAASGRGCGAFLLIESILEPISLLQSKIVTCAFERTSSTRLELQILLHALKQAPTQAQVTVYTDSQNIIDLPGRRIRLEAQEYRSKKGRALNNADLYQRFFEFLDQSAPALIKVKGHSPAAQKSRVEQVFTLVDRAARNCSRSFGLPLAEQ